MRDLEPELRMVVDLCYVKQRRYHEAARELGVSVDTVARRLRRARERLRQLIATQRGHRSHAAAGASPGVVSRADGAMIERHRPQLIRLALRLTATVEAADQLVEETVARATACEHHPRGDELAAWLVALLTRVFLEQLRQSVMS
jgi:DNA-directed RNA polymerase specialized sigma24 family protein